LLKIIVIKLRKKWLNSRNLRLACVPSLGPYKKLVLCVKKPTAIGNAMKSNAKSTNEKLAEIPIEKRIYVDESEMDERDNYGYAWNPCGESFYALKSGRR
jgi:hypothetical protein